MKDREEPLAEQTAPENNNKQLNWITKVKIHVVIMDKGKRAKGRSFMKRVKKMGSKVSTISSLVSLIQVRQREEQPQYQEQQQEEEEELTIKE